MLTLTAPSEGEHRAWVVDWDGKTPRPWCSCTAEGGLGWWNASSGKCWNRLRGELVRAYPGMEFFRGVETQERGALHDHVIVWTPTPLVLVEVQRLAVAAGFGCVVDFKPAKAGDTRQAAYVSKYVTKATDDRRVVPWDVVDNETGEISAGAEAKYRTWSCSRGWGLTMKAVEHGIREAALRRVARLHEVEGLLTVPAGAESACVPVGSALHEDPG